MDFLAPRNVSPALEVCRIEAALELRADWWLGFGDGSLQSTPEYLERFSRAQRIRQEMTGDPTTRPSSGALLSFFPEWSLTLGFGTEETEGFLNLEDSPPPLFWLDILESEVTDSRGNVGNAVQLVAWVPERMIALVNAGVEYDAAGCITWEIRSPEVAAIRKQLIAGGHRVIHFANDEAATNWVKRSALP